MANITLKRKDRIVQVDSKKKGTIRILLNSGFVQVKASAKKPKPSPSKPKDPEPNPNEGNGESTS